MKHLALVSASIATVVSLSLAGVGSALADVKLKKTPTKQTSKMRKPDSQPVPRLPEVVKCFHSSLNKVNPTQQFYRCSKDHFQAQLSEREIRSLMAFLPYADKVSEPRTCTERETKVSTRTPNGKSPTLCFDLQDKEGRQRVGFAFHNGDGKIMDLLVF